MYNFLEYSISWYVIFSAANYVRVSIRYKNKQIKTDLNDTCFTLSLLCFFFLVFGWDMSYWPLRFVICKGT